MSSCRTLIKEIIQCAKTIRYLISYYDTHTYIYLYVCIYLIAFIYIYLFPMLKKITRPK